MVELEKEDTTEATTLESVDDCDDEQKKIVHKKKSNCKLFHHDPYWTPNNYDLYFNYFDIPVNIGVEGSADLHYRLQKTLPLSKVLHLNLETKNVPQNNQINVCEKIKLKWTTEDKTERTVELR